MHFKHLALEIRSDHLCSPHTWRMLMCANVSEQSSVPVCVVAFK